MLTASAGMPLAVMAPVPQPSSSEMRENRRRDERLCRSAARHRADLARLEAGPDTLSRIAEYLWRGEGGCRKDPALAIAVLRFAIGDSALAFDDARIVAQLASYLKERSDFRDLAELNELQKILWVRGYSKGDLAPLWLGTEMRAFVARDDIWTFLSSPRPNGIWAWTEAIRFQALLDPLSPRYAPYEGIAIIEKGVDSDRWLRGARLLLEGAKDLPPDPVRAEALLMRAAPDKDEARLLLAETLVQRLASPDAAVRAAAINRFAAWSTAKEPGTIAIRAALLPALRAQLGAADRDEQRQAVGFLTQYALTDPGADHGALLRWADAALRRGDTADKVAGWRALVSLSDARIAGADRIMAEGFARAGGMVDRGTLRAEDLRRIVTSDDYPARATREKVEGVVDAEVIFSPDGRVLQVIVTKAPPPVLADEVRKTVTRRLRLRPAPDRYVRARLAPIQFRVTACAVGTERTAAVEGALLVDSSFCPSPPPDLPIP